VKIENNKEIYQRYLLGDQTESERERLEQEYFANPEVLQELQSAEDDLIDAYVRGTLSARQREQFEKHYLDSASKRRRVEFASTLRTLSTELKEQDQDQERIIPATNIRYPEAWYLLVSKPALAAALTLALIFLTVLALQSWRLRSELRKAQSEQAGLQSQIQQLGQESAALQAKLAAKGNWPVTAEGVTVSMLLLPGSDRGPGARANPLSVPPHAASVVLILDIGQHLADSYRAVLETAEGVEVRVFDNLKTYPLENGDQAIFLSLPADSLKRGDFVIRVFSHTDQEQIVELHPYSLRVLR
jgi:hypothetical protein